LQELGSSFSSVPLIAASPDICEVAEDAVIIVILSSFTKMEELPVWFANVPRIWLRNLPADLPMIKMKTDLHLFLRLPQK